MEADQPAELHRQPGQLLQQAGEAIGSRQQHQRQGICDGHRGASREHRARKLDRIGKDDVAVRLDVAGDDGLAGDVGNLPRPRRNLRVRPNGHDAIAVDADCRPPGRAGLNIDDVPAHQTEVDGLRTHGFQHSRTQGRGFSPGVIVVERGEPP